MRLDEKDTSSPPPYDSPRYVYYQVYAQDGAIPSKRAADPAYPFIGRIKGTSVPPPLTVASLKRTLAHAERIPDPHGLRTDLYRLPTDQTPMDDTEAVSILGAGPAATASTPAEALALVFVDELSDEEKGDVPLTDAVPVSQVTEDVYYRLHTRFGEDYSIRAFDPEEPALGRIDRSTVSPPRNALAIKRCIAKTEGNPIYAFADLYADVSDGPLTNDDCISLGPESGHFRASNAADALRIVQPERRPGLYNRALKILEAQSAYSTFPFWHGARHFLHHGAPARRDWLEVAAGDIVYTDGIIERVDCMVHHVNPAQNPGNPQNPGFPNPNLHMHPMMMGMQPHAAYTVVNASGVKGLIKAENVKFLDE